MKSNSKLTSQQKQVKAKIDSKESTLNPIVDSLTGSFKMPKDFYYKKELRKRIEEKRL